MTVETLNYPDYVKHSGNMSLFAEGYRGAWHIDNKGNKSERFANRKSRLGNNPYSHGEEYEWMNEMFRHPEKPIHPDVKGVIAGRAMGDLVEYLGKPQKHYAGRYSRNDLFRRSVRALYMLGNLRTSKTARRAVEKALEGLKDTDRFEYAMSHRMVEMMLEEGDKNEQKV